ncbi:MAG: tetratricopeptide repeat protein [Steroidobacteraceae bacterium]
MRRLEALILLLLGGALASSVAWSAHRAPDTLPKQRVQDLHYGDVLFRFYSGDTWGALTSLEAYEHWQRMPHNEQDAQLLAGSLYLTLGMHNEAGRRFAGLLTDKVPAAIRNRAWFYLAKVWYTRGYFDRTEESLSHISGVLEPELEAERQHLSVNVLMREQRFDEASARLAHWQGPPDWMAYARFNLGVALVRQNRLAEADPVLTLVGTMDAPGSEMASLRDKANLALGYAWLQANNPAAARTALERVRLSGPYSTRALLGMGWAEAALGQYREALTPWTELHGRNLLDAAVQESYLAVPYAYGKLSANAQAAEYYESAIKSFDSEAQQIDTAVARIGEGHMTDDLLLTDRQADRQGWFWQLKQLPDAPQSRYLYSLLADNDFQEGLKNYRDLAYLGGTLKGWDESMDAFRAMIDTREKAHAERLPRTDALLASDAPAKLLAARAAVDSRLTAIETGADVAALGSPEERAQWAKVRALEGALADATGMDADELQTDRDKLRLMKGVLYWKLDAQFKERSYAERRELRALDALLNEAQNRWVRVQRARSSVPTNTGEFETRIAALAQRIADLKLRLGQSAQMQNQYLEHMASSALLEQKDRLAAYEVQARFALADIYDRASAPPPAPAAPAAPAVETPAAPAAPAPDSSAPPADSGATPQ